MKRVHKALALLIVGALGESVAHGATSADVLQESLNVMTEVSSADAKELPKQCQKFKVFVEKVTPILEKHPQLSKLSQRLQEFEKRVCPDGNSAFENAPPVAPLPNMTVWSSQPKCKERVGVIPYCEFRHTNGRGLFALSQNDKLWAPNFLVCASTAGSQQMAFGSDYLIETKCRISNVDWIAGSGRPDVQGLFYWLEQPATRTSIEIPQALAQQCDTMFPEAVFCSPTLMVLPTQKRDFVDVCSLETYLAKVDFVVVRVSSGNSRWTCETKNLRNVDAQENLTAQEWGCVPNQFGKTDGRCALPYIPTTQNWRSHEVRSSNPVPLP